MKYKGVVFNSVTVRALRGPLADAVRARRIRTAVVSNHNRTQVAEALAREGASVDLVVGGFDLSRYGEYRKPMPDLLFVAAAKLGLETGDMVCVADCERDEEAARAAGMDIVAFSEAESLVDQLDENPPAPAPRDFSDLVAPVTGLMGTIVGDVVGSVYEHHPTTDFNFPLFPPRSKPTDDTVGSLAIARWLLGDRTRENLIRSMTQLCNSYPRAGYSHRFKAWLRSVEHAPYGGNTNGSAMRVGACGWAADSLEEALDLARQTAEVSHNSDEGIRGAQSVAAAIFLARTGLPKDEIRRYVESTFGYDFSPTVDDIRRTATRAYNCDVSIPQAFCCWLQSETYEQTVRNAVSLATDADTIAAIAGGLAAATPGMEIPQEWADKVFRMLKPDLKAILVDFNELTLEEELDGPGVFDDGIDFDDDDDLGNMPKEGTILYSVMAANGILAPKDRARYVEYDPANPGCSVDNPIVIDIPSDLVAVPLEYALLEYLLRPVPYRFVDYEVGKQQLVHHNGRSLDVLSVKVYTHPIFTMDPSGNLSRSERRFLGTELYWFDITVAMDALHARFNKG